MIATATMEQPGKEKKRPIVERSSSAGPLGPAILVSGFLTKRTRTMNRWTRRWWQLLDDGTLLYFKSEERTTLLGQIDIGQSCYDVRLGAETCKVIFPRVVPSCCCFAFSVLKRTYYVYAPNAAEAKRWVECINSASSVLSRDRKRGAHHRPAPSRPHSVSYPPTQATEIRKSYTVSHSHDQDVTNKRHSIAVPSPHEDLYRLDLEGRDKPGDLPVFVTMRRPRPRSHQTMPSPTAHRHRHRSVPVLHPSGPWQGDPRSLSASLWLDGTPQVVQPVTSSPGTLRTQSPYLQTACTTPLRGSWYASHGNELNTLHLRRPIMTEVSRGGTLPRVRPSRHRSMSSIPHPQSTFGKELEKLEEREAMLRKQLAMMETPPRPAYVADYPASRSNVYGLGNPYSRPPIGVPVLPAAGIRYGNLEFFANRTQLPPPVKPKPIMRGRGTHRPRPPTFVTATRLLPISSPTESASSVTVNTATITRYGDSPRATPTRYGDSPRATPTRYGDSPRATPTRYGDSPRATPTRYGDSPRATPTRYGDSPRATPTRYGDSPRATPPGIKQNGIPQTDFYDYSPLSPRQHLPPRPWLQLSAAQPQPPNGLQATPPFTPSPKQTSQFWGLDGRKSSDARARDANIWAWNELQKVSRCQ